ncbi:tripartite tricarboxylate transporter substrate binding protein [Xylophilus sp. GOD-11R]|uniref:tripartite tricarboxylate transporter substrate binding protein n=1 Tax=Xylophilus sp. GOD-11R TaxID=3089814 RepID=UPI00298D3A03|nr:tripartite tricarboxylate transporter substrate binding protein [Xylophilus sp. GOD-11R]WPB54976.1 tripartite tricarboxylate transporter substrate binding protein [Xylophilus sp. GOD-11R]
MKTSSPWRLGRRLAPWLSSLVAAGLCLSSAHVRAQDAYPAKPIHMVLSTSPGGGADITMRIIAPKLQERLGQPVVIENRPGASGMIAGAYVARQPADGYTFLVDIASFPVNPALYPRMGYDPFKDLAPVTQNIQAPNVLLVPPGSPVKSVGGFITYAKARKGAMSYASSGNGSAQHLAMELFKLQEGIELTHVPYKGGGAALADVMAGHVDAYIGFLPTAAPGIKSGRLIALATTGKTRDPSTPNLPTMAEAGVAGFVSYDWNGVFAPAATPRPIIDRIQREIAAILAEPDVKARLAEMGSEPVASTPEQFGKFLHQEAAKWAKVVKDARISVE